MRALLSLFLLALLIAGCDSTEEAEETAQLSAEAGDFTWTVVLNGSVPSGPVLPITVRNEGTVELNHVHIVLRTRSTNGFGGGGAALVRPLAPGASAVIQVPASGVDDPDFVCYSYTVTYSYFRSGTLVEASAPTTGGTCPS